MLLDDFCSLSNVKHTDHSIDANVKFNETHPIFGGHFEGFPVVPGVCMMQLIKEIMEKELHKDFRLTTANQMKFLTIINPNENPEVSANIEYDLNGGNDISFEARLFSGETTFFKLKASMVNGE